MFVDVAEWSALKEGVRRLKNVMLGPGLEGGFGTEGLQVVFSRSLSPSPFFAQVTGFDEVEANRWDYTFAEVYGSPWSIKPGGKQGNARNLNECLSPVPGIHLLPCSIGNIVVAFTLKELPDLPSFWFPFKNDRTCTGGTVKVLAQTPGELDSDSWDRGVDDCPVEVQMVTDSACRLRTFNYDRCGNLVTVSAEGDEV